MAADNFRVRGQYKQAIELLQQAIEKDGHFMEAYFRLGVTYKSARQYPQAILAFESGLREVKEERAKRGFWYELGETQFLTGNYDEASALLSKYVQTEVASVQNRARFDNARKMIDNAVFAKANQALAKEYEQRVLSDTVNCFPLQYFPVLTADEQSLIFTRRLGNKDTDDEDIVISGKDEQGKWRSPVSLSENINSTLNEGTCAISADGRTLIFTSCVGRDGWGSCDLYQSTKTGEEWSAPKNLGVTVNSAEWESQPSLSADGRTLYFVSDRRGGFGRRDIWVSVRDASGNWTRARNLGKEINTVYDEISPFIHANNGTLYFSSNGLTGFGGYDIFYSERKDGKWLPPTNVGAPINTHEDQFSFFVAPNGAKAYYSHEAAGAVGLSESKIYETLIPEARRPTRTSNFVKGVVRDKKTRQPLMASIELVNLETDSLEALTQSDSLLGNYLMVLTKGAKYALYINSPHYLFASLAFDYTTELGESVVIDIDLERIESGSNVVLNNIFFEFDSFEIKPESFSEINKVIRFLNENPRLSIEITGHTDNQGSEQYNLQLSRNRAQAVVRYLIDHGISAKRVNFKGAGSSSPIADNTSEAGQRKNRRIEFKIL